jgi:hypothetical protein
MRTCALLLAFVSLASGQTTRKPVWKIEKIGLSQVTDRGSTVTATITNSARRESFKLSDPSVLTETTDAYISGDRLVLMGSTPRAAAVEIFDLPRRAKVDWFVCYEPHRLTGRWIEYIEFYPRWIPGGEPTDVMLVYDLAKTPVDNRPGNAADERIQVGFPIFPTENAATRSYRNVVDVPSAARGVLGAPVLLSFGKVVFVAMDGPGLDVTGKRDVLVAVDLSRGLKNPPIQQIDIPKDQLRRNPSSRVDVLSVTKLQAVSPHAVRLVFPPGLYAVDSLVVDVPSK